MCFVAESQLRNYIEWINDDNFFWGVEGSLMLSIEWVRGRN